MTKVSESRRAHEMERDATCQSCGHLCDAPGEFHPHLFCVLKRGGVRDPWGEFRWAAGQLGVTLPERPPRVRDLPLAGVSRGDIRSERLEAAARALYEHKAGVPEWGWDGEAEENRDLYRAEARKALGAADAVTRPDWIIEAWRQEVADLSAEAARYRNALERLRAEATQRGRPWRPWRAASLYPGAVYDAVTEALGGGDDRPDGKAGSTVRDVARSRHRGASEGAAMTDRATCEPGGHVWVSGFNFCARCGTALDDNRRALKAPKVVSLTQTCTACPSQWEGLLDDGRRLYVRYRWGRLSYGIGTSIEEAVTAPRCEFEMGGPDGFMDEAEMRERLSGHLDFGGLE